MAHGQRRQSEGASEELEPQPSRLSN